MLVTQTRRLQLRWLTPDDAPFIFQLVNDPDWLRFIGDKQIRTLEDARDYIRNELMKAYRELGFGLNLVERTADSVPIGICGLKKRDGLDHPDLGFAFLPAFRGRGYAFEACEGVTTHTVANAYGPTNPQPVQLQAITTPENTPSIRLLEKLGFGFVRVIALPRSTTELRLYALSIEEMQAIR